MNRKLYIYIQQFGIILLLLISNCLYAQNKWPSWSDSLFSAYYHQQVSLFEQLPQTSGDIIFLGNSLTDGGEWSELFNNNRIKNRGISGDITAGVLNRIEEVINRKPAKVFLLIGINDLSRGIQPDSVVKNIMRIAQYVHQFIPGTKLYVQSILPVSSAFALFGNHTNKTESINAINSSLAMKADANHYTYIDLNSHFCDGRGWMKEQFTNDGLHLKGDGYLLWKHLVFPYVYDLTTQPALIPAPRQVSWRQGFFSLYKCSTIVVKDNNLPNEAKQLQRHLQEMGYTTSIKNTGSQHKNYIELKLTPLVPGKNKEAYELEVTTDRITIASSTSHGIFNGIQTFLQLCRNGSTVELCSIKDEPAFSWRGYMIDVGRNYMSVDLLKQQIDVMSRYKLNVFHFHATEDVAWRIAIQQYPQLTDAAYMLRNKGMYYTRQDIKELIAYCRERHITFVPEIDMPGHSDAFKRAMKTDMQSDTGVQYVKNILKEFCETYDVPYIHIGADEVKITNQHFVPEMTRYIESLGKTVIGWQPGGNFTNSTWRQLWMEDNGHGYQQSPIKYIDSRHLYLNHMDPLEAVVTIFNRKIGDKNKGDSSLQGATLCMWHDRAVRDERDVLTMNPVYPGMLAFSERAWNGGGLPGWVSNVSDGNEALFAEFENRLLNHKILYFKNKPFPYVRQSDLKWELSGPFNNNGNVGQVFSPETGKPAGMTVTKMVTGGTIVMRHWWAPKVKGAVDKPEENTTWYATTQIWSDEAGEKDFWIGFNNLSRSPATDSPPASTWDNKGSKLWINGLLVKPPLWNRPGQKGNAEIPLSDEGYEYRAATKILLKRGWNKVLVKLPIAGFKGKDWHNPVKWMFTFVQVEPDK